LVFQLNDRGDIHIRIMVPNKNMCLVKLMWGFIYFLVPYP